MPQPSDDITPEELLDILRQIEEPPSEPDEVSFEAEARSLDRKAKEIELEDLKEGVEHRKQDREQRRTYASLAFALVCIWLAAVLWFLYLQGVGGNVIVLSGLLHFGPFHLSDSVLIMLIGSTTASVVAIFIVVARHLFPRRDSN